MEYRDVFSQKNSPNPLLTVVMAGGRLGSNDGDHLYLGPQPSTQLISSLTQYLCQNYLHLSNKLPCLRQGLVRLVKWTMMQYQYNVTHKSSTDIAKITFHKNNLPRVDCIAGESLPVRPHQPPPSLSELIASRPFCHTVIP